jgi:hypothetical protein
MTDTLSIQSEDIDWLQLIILGNLSAEEQRDLWNNRAFYRKNSAKVNAFLNNSRNKQEKQNG